MNITVVVLHYENIKDTRECLDSLKKYLDDTKNNINIVVVDNGSIKEKTAAIEKEYLNDKIHFIESGENLGFAKGNNIGFIKFKKVNGEYEVERISEIPENYDKFLEKFEEYKSKHPDILENNTQTQSIAGKEDNYNANETIEKISNGVFTVSLIAGIIVGIIIILTICKKKIKNAGK